MGEQRNNVLLHPLPEEWEGYRIVPDFRVGVQIVQLLDDPDYSQAERLAYASELLFEDMPETMEECVQGLVWFLGGWNHDNRLKKQDDEIVVMDYMVDQWRIYAAFMQQYHIDLDKAELHFWSFMGLLTNLEECHFTQVRDMRAMKETGDMSAKQKEALRNAKKIYGISRENPEGDKMSEAREEFLKFAGLNK